MIKNEASQEAKTSSVQTVIHDGHVMQRFADGNVAVIGHGSQKVKLIDSQENEKTNKTKTNKQKNSLTIIKRDGFFSCNNGGQELGYTESCE